MQKISDFARDCVLKRKNIARVFFGFVGFFNFSAYDIEKLCGNADFAVGDLIIRGENVIRLLFFPGGKRVFIEEADALIKSGAALIDVLPSDGAGLDRTTGAWHMAKPHQNIPGSTWLPDVGRGQVDPLIDAYFQKNLARLSKGDSSRTFLIYCQSDCWMGWNAVKRASSYGYTSLYWYADGVDGWRDWDRPFAAAEPVPVEIK